VQPEAVAQVLRRASAVVGGEGRGRPPFAVSRYAARCGVVIPADRRLPPHTPQWNGAVALAVARTFVPAGTSPAAAAALAEIGAAELLLPMRIFRPIAAKTDLTMDGLTDLALRFGAPIRLTARQWLRTGSWRGFALLWRDEHASFVLGWRAASPTLTFPRALRLGTPAAATHVDSSRLDATFRTGRPHHGVEEIRTGRGTAWWFVRFGVVRDDAEDASHHGRRAVLALVTLAAG
jgi:hypothetical protein